MPITIYDTNNQPITVPEDQAADAISSGTHGVDTSYEYNMLAPDGKNYKVPGTGVSAALSNGWALSKNMSATELEHQKNVDADNGLFGASGPIAAGATALANHAGSALSLGALDVLNEKYMPEKQKQYEESLREKHPTVNAIAAGAGEAAGFVASAPAFGVAEAGGELVGKGVLSLGEKTAIEGMTKAAVDEAGKTALKKTLTSQIANYATQGAILASPQAVTEAALGDPKAAGESLMWGIGVGGILGAGAFGLGKVTSKAGTLIDAIGPKADEIANQNAMKAMGIQKGGARKLGEEGIERSAQVLFDNGIIKPGQSFKDLQVAIENLEQSSGQKIGDFLGSMDDLLDKNKELRSLAFKPYDAAMRIENELGKGLETPMYASERAELSKIVDSVAGLGKEDREFEKPKALIDYEEQVSSLSKRQEEQDLAFEKDLAAHNASEAQRKAEYDAQLAGHDIGTSFKEKEYLGANEEGRAAHDAAEAERRAAWDKEVLDREKSNFWREQKGAPKAANDDYDIAQFPEGSSRVPGEKPTYQDSPLFESKAAPEVKEPLKAPEYPGEHPDVKDYLARKELHDVANEPIPFKKAQELKELFNKFPLSKLDPSPKELLQQRARGIVNGMIQESADKVVQKATELGMDINPNMYADYMKQKNIYRATQDIIKYGIDNKIAQSFGNKSFSLTDFIAHGKGPLAIGGAGIGAAIAGVPGAFVGLQAGAIADFMLKHWAENKGLSTSAYYLKKLAKDPQNLPFIGPMIAHNGVKAMNAHLDQIAKIFDNQPKRLVQFGANQNIQKLVGGSGQTKQQQFAKLASQIQNLAANPTSIGDSLSPIIGTIAPYSPAVASNYLNTSVNAIKYLDSVLPKNPNPIPKPFEINEWLPSDQQMHDFNEKLGVVMNPSSVLHDIHNGTVTKAKIDALHIVYPTYAEQVKARIMEMGMDKKTKLSEEAKLKMSLMFGTPIGKGMRNLSLYQGSYVPPKPPGQSSRGASKIKDLPSLSTKAERLSNKDAS